MIPSKRRGERCREKREKLQDSLTGGEKEWRQCLLRIIKNSMSDLMRLFLSFLHNLWKCDHLPWSPTTTTVISSREKLTFCQISVATLTNLSAACSS
jgi:hypothetical protein